LRKSSECSGPAVRARSSQSHRPRLLAAAPTRFSPLTGSPESGPGDGRRSTNARRARGLHRAASQVLSAPAPDGSRHRRATVERR
jgi:hypothetical protein